MKLKIEKKSHTGKLLLAIKSRNFDKLKYLLSLNKYIDKKILWFAIKNGNISALTILLGKISFEFSIAYAIEINKPNLINFLIEHDSDEGIKFALEFAAKNHYNKVVKSLIKHNKNNANHKIFTSNKKGSGILNKVNREFTVK